MNIQTRYEHIINQPIDNINQEEVLELYYDIMDELYELSNDTSNWSIMKQLVYKDYLRQLYSYLNN